MPTRSALKRFYILCFMMYSGIILQAQSSQDTLMEKENRRADDPSAFLTRLELYNELQYHDEDYYFNQTVLRTIIKIGKRFTTRLDLPLIHNSFSPSPYDQLGLGDISFRLLGYQVSQAKKSAITVSFEVSLNTAASPLLGTGKNIIIPVITYTKLIPKQKMFFAVFIQQANSFSGDDNRQKVSFTKVQPILVKYWSLKTWTVFAPSIYIDYIQDGGSMNLEARHVFSPVPRMNLWGQAGVGVFGDFPARYVWSVQIGCRYFLLRKMNFN